MSGERSLYTTTPREPLAAKMPALSWQSGARVGGYVIERPLGVGGMARVFVATDEQLARTVALKLLPPEDADAEGRARFLREAQALARVQHKNVVQVYASGVDGDVAWMALEYVAGDALAALVDGGPVDEETALSLCAQAARGLAAVHSVGVVHRDLKPDNLILDDDGCVRVLDFGVALLLDGNGPRVGGFVTQAGVAVGTPHFMAPEQARGGRIDARADAWGLGATLVMLLTGKPPFYTRDDEPDLDILARVLRERAPDVRARAPGTSAATADLVTRLLDPDAEHRLWDMSEIARSCEAIADALAAGTPPPVAAPPAVEAPPVDPPPGGPSSVERAGSSTVGTPARPPRREYAPAPTSRNVSVKGVVAVALLFSGLGAVVAAQLAQRPAPPPAVPAAAEAPAVPSLPAPPAPAPPAPSPSDGAAVAEAAPLASSSPAAFVPPTAAALEEQALAMADALPARGGPLWELVARDDDDARAAVARLLRAPAVFDATVDAIAALEARAHVGALARVLPTAPPGQAARIIDVLVALRPFEALAILDDTASHHPNAGVRRRAADARAGLFRVEGQ